MEHINHSKKKYHNPQLPKEPEAKQQLQEQTIVKTEQNSEEVEVSSSSYSGQDISTIEISSSSSSSSFSSLKITEKNNQPSPSNNNCLENSNQNNQNTNDVHNNQHVENNQSSKNKTNNHNSNSNTQNKQKQSQCAKRKRNESDNPRKRKKKRKAPKVVKSLSGEKINIENSEFLKIWSIKREDIILGKKVGVGACGSIMRGKWHNTDVAIKRLHREDDAAVEMFNKEVQIMCKMRHKNIVQYYGVCLENDFRCVVMEFMPSTLAIVLNKGPLALPQFLKIAKGVSRGMTYLHYSNIIHRDLKPSNILLDRQAVPKLCDFGVSKETEGSNTMTTLGTPLYMAPEMLRTRTYGKKVDVYSFAMVLWQMITGEKLIKGFGFETSKITPLQIALNVCVEKARPTIPASSPAWLTNLICSCWAHEQADRPTFDDIID
eukprot:CAMPEP_0174257848 /NCGR_PEP_ID=MMETSP0439-20130205/6952_1 /TAXON_ID=0 /ORGANISM="Stereomyxa ramosa, Strain Chinc5" /LENGTH=432 /DNA_ID=CAMNT_0015341127 /DNA_START=847 /DNA_END=2141 /DNA_ORIENTATION=-